MEKSRKREAERQSGGEVKEGATWRKREEGEVREGGSVEMKGKKKDIWE